MQLIIDGNIIELGESSPAITRQSIDIDRPSLRFVDFTNRFKLPDNIETRKIFGSPQAVGSNNRSYDKLYNVVLIDVSRIFRGKGFLVEGTKDNFSFQIIDESKELFKALDVDLKQIEWDDKDTILTQAAIDALDTADPDHCFVWGKLCLHEKALQINTDQTTGDARTKYSRPSLYVQGLLKRAIELQGYSYSAPNLDLAISCYHSDFFFTSYQKTLSGNYSPSGILALTGLDTNDFEHADLTVASTTINIGASNTIFRLRGSAISDAAIDMIIKATDNVDPTKISESKLSLSVGVNEIDFSSSEFESEDGYTIDISFVGTGTVSFDDLLLYTILSEKNKDLSTNPWLGYKIKAYDNLPELTYLDLFRLICTTANQFHVIDTQSKTFGWGTLANLNKNNAVDWSDKFIKESDSITSHFSKLSQRNRLRYENDKTVNIDLGCSEFLTDNESLSEENEYMSFAFGASDDITLNSNDVSHVRIYNDTTRIQDQDINIRIFAVSGSNIVFAPIDWVNIKENYYKNWFNSLERVRLINCQMNLSKLDVLSWHEKQLIYIDHFKTTFIVLGINNFIPRRSTKVKILAYGR